MRPVNTRAADLTDLKSAVMDPEFTAPGLEIQPFSQEDYFAETLPSKALLACI